MVRLKRLSLGLGACALALFVLSIFDPSANAKSAQIEAWSLFVSELQPKDPIAFETANHGDGAAWVSGFRAVPLKGVSVWSNRDYRMRDAKGTIYVRIATRDVRKVGWNRWEVSVRSTFGFDDAQGKTFVLQSFFGRWWLIETKEHWIT